jgi:Coenzyme PQQ synthesis protein D (PqqD)
MTVHEQQLISRTGNLVEAGVDDELFVLDVDGGNCFGFNATASDIWRMLKSPMKLGTLCDALVQSCDVDRETCLSETAALIETLAKDELVVLTPA